MVIEYSLTADHRGQHQKTRDGGYECKLDGYNSSTNRITLFFLHLSALSKNQFTSGLIAAKLIRTVRTNSILWAMPGKREMDVNV